MLKCCLNMAPRILQTSHFTFQIILTDEPNHLSKSVSPKCKQIAIQAVVDQMMLHQVKFMFLIIISLELVSKCLQQRNNFPVSPCPNVFLYKYDGQEWYGEIKAPTSFLLQQQSAMLKVTFTLRLQHNVSLTAQETTFWSFIFQFKLKPKINIKTFRRFKLVERKSH